MADPTFWSCRDDEEQLSHTDRDEAVEAYLDDLLNPGMTAAEVLEELPGTVDVFGFARAEIDAGRWAKLCTEELLHCLDDEYGDPNGDFTKPNEAMLAAANAFVAAVLAEYEPWMCEQVHKETVKVEPWVREHRPDWLEDEHG